MGNCCLSKNATEDLRDTTDTAESINYYLYCGYNDKYRLIELVANS